MKGTHKNHEDDECDKCKYYRKPLKIFAFNLSSDDIRVNVESLKKGTVIYCLKLKKECVEKRQLYFR